MSWTIPGRFTFSSDQRCVGLHSPCSGETIRGSAATSSTGVLGNIRFLGCAWQTACPRSQLEQGHIERLLPKPLFQEGHERVFLFRLGKTNQFQGQFVDVDWLSKLADQRRPKRGNGGTEWCDIASIGIQDQHAFGAGAAEAPKDEHDKQQCHEADFAQTTYERRYSHRLLVKITKQVNRLRAQGITVAPTARLNREVAGDSRGRRTTVTSADAPCQAGVPSFTLDLSPVEYAPPSSTSGLKVGLMPRTAGAPIVFTLLG